MADALEASNVAGTMSMRISARRAVLDFKQTTVIRLGSRARSYREDSPVLRGLKPEA